MNADPYTVYTLETGAVLYHGEGSVGMVIHDLPEGAAILDQPCGDRQLTHRIVDEEFVAKEPLAFDIFDHTITVPINTQYTVTGPAHTNGITTDGIIELEFAEPGEYTIRLSLFPYLDHEVIINAD